MSYKNDGGPAFPVPGFPNDETFNGMTLRDYFAAKAMGALISTAAAPCLNGLDGYETHTARASYKMADAMLAAREIKS